MPVRSRHKLSYVPGIISLLILPVAFYALAIKHQARMNFRVIGLHLSDTIQFKKYTSLYGSYNGHIPPLRDYLQINLTGNATDNKTKIEFARLYSREIILNDDTSRGIHFQFDTSATYGSYVGVIDALRQEHARWYMCINNHVWFYLLEPRPVPKTAEFSCLLCSDVVFVKPTTTWWEIQKLRFKHAWDSSWQIIVASWAFLIAMSLAKKYTRFIKISL